MLSVKRELVFWAGSGIGRPKLGAAFVGLGLDPRLGVGLLISKFPRVPRLVALGPFFPVVICTGEAITGQHLRAG